MFWQQTFFRLIAFVGSLRRKVKRVGLSLKIDIATVWKELCGFGIYDFEWF